MIYERVHDYWLPVFLLSSLKRKPVRVVFRGQPVVLFRAGETVKALLDRCPHRGAPLSEGVIREDCVVCPYHGWTFDGTGACREIPGRLLEPKSSQNAVAVPVKEMAGFIWLGSPDALDPYLSPYLTEPGYDRFHWVVRLSGDLVNVVENFLDATHTHHVHTGLVRGEKARSNVRVEVVREGDRCTATYHGEENPSGLISKLFEGTRSTSRGRFALPAVAEIEYSSARRVEFVMTAYLVPAEGDEFVVQVTIATPRGLLPAGLKRAVLTPFLKAALRQDQDILEKQRANLETFPDHRHLSTELDVLRPHILNLLKHGPSAERVERVVEMRL